MDRDTVELLCIAGTGRNGATMLTRMLGELPGYVAVGELGYLWDKGLIKNQDCSCGLSFLSCPFWEQVGQEAFGGWDQVDAREITTLRESASFRHRHLSLWMSLPFLLAPRLSPRYRRQVLDYAEVMGKLYRGIHVASGGRIIVDSMKRPYHVLLPRHIPGIDMSVVHLVRDSRGVVYSRFKLVDRRQATVATDLLKVQAEAARKGATKRGGHPPLRSAFHWLSINLAFQTVLPRLSIPTSIVRYEDLVRAPRQVLRRLTGASDDDLAFVQGNVVDLPPGHLVAGNQVRLSSGPLSLREDDAWRTGLVGRRRRAVELVTWPLMRRYAYLGSRARPTHS